MRPPIFWNSPEFGASCRCVVLLVFLASCHDAPRTNPFDPALTPAVELQVALDDTAGTATLTWSRYEGQQPFREYWVLRKVPGLEAVDTLVHISAVEQLTFVDSSLVPGTDYLYRMSVVNSGGLEVPSPEEKARPLSLPVVRLIAAQLDSRTATAVLRWTAYQGPRFKAYRLERRSAGLATLVVKEITDLADTTYVDSLLSGNTEYFYRVVVLTERGEELPSEERSGKFHALLATWPLGEDMQPRGRLYVEPGNRIVALVPRKNGSSVDSPYSSWVLSFDPEGQHLEEQMLSVVPLAPWALSDEATCLNPEGRRFLGLSNEGTAGILSFRSDGQPLFRERTLFTDAFPNLSAAEKVVQGEILFTGYEGYYDNVRVSAGGRLLFAEDFEEFPEGTLLETQGYGWEWSLAGFAIIDQGRVDNGNAKMSRADETWQNFRLEAEVAAYKTPGPGIQIGGDTFSSFVLTLNLINQQVLLDWRFSPPGELELEPQEKSLPLPLMARVFYDLSLEAVDGAVSASMRDPMVWTELLGLQYVPLWTSLALVGDILAFTRDEQVYSITQEGEVLRQASFEAPISEIRVWEDPRDGTQWVGICMPDVDRIWMNKVPAGNPSNWPRLLTFALAFTLKPELGPPAGSLSSPISFAMGPDGRFYVLDAGNGRVVVFDAERHYLTQWGRKGSEEGEFDFGRGGGGEQTPRHFAGSIAVDSQGYIYVLDVFNKRIQKFAP